MNFAFRGFYEVRDVGTIFPMQEKPAENVYSVEEATRLLGRTPERIRQMLRAGELEGGVRRRRSPSSVEVYQFSVDARRDRRSRSAHKPELAFPVHQCPYQSSYMTVLEMLYQKFSETDRGHSKPV